MQTGTARGTRRENSIFQPLRGRFRALAVIPSPQQKETARRKGEALGENELNRKAQKLQNARPLVGRDGRADQADRNARALTGVLYPKEIITQHGEHEF